MSALPKFTMKELLDAGVHFGHKTMRWNPRMAPYIYGTRNNTHIIDLQKTVPLLHNALQAARDIAANNGRVLFVSTKRQAAPIVADAAQRCGQHYVNHRWLGGMMTNWGTVSASIKTLRSLEETLADPEAQLSKKERLSLERQHNKIELSLGGIKDMGGVPDLLFIIDTNKEHIAIKEAEKLGIPVIAIVDTNANPEGISYPIPGNDDATRSIQLYCDLICEAILKGIQASVGNAPKAKAAEKAPAAPKAEKADASEDDAKTPAKKAAAKKAEPAKKAPAKKAPAEKTAAKADDAKSAAKEAKSDDNVASVKKAEKEKASQEEAPAKKAASS